ncbi:hypothetical protein NIES4103_07420 [Nostoc sp. NIES-4103]|nr:hypothetical protein NIES4103_07420 [Nostoc sp. NIES-4103]
MTQAQKNFCFCTLALGKKYRLLAQQLAKDLEKNAPGTFLVIYTDEPKDFSKQSNTIAEKYRQIGILFCYHDKRFVLEKALSEFPVAIQIDADTRILKNVPDVIPFAGIVGRQENLVEHVKKYNPERLKAVKKVASKLNLPLENAPYVGESLYFVGRDNGKEKEFIKYWGMIGRYLELQGIHSGDGIAIGLAAAKVGWTINSENWETFRKISQHLDASHESKTDNWLNAWQRRLSYHYRLNLARLMALKNFEFYYR